jgi:hypothetical protein
MRHLPVTEEPSAKLAVTIPRDGEVAMDVSFFSYCLP